MLEQLDVNLHTANQEDFAIMKTINPTILILICAILTCNGIKEQCAIQNLKVNVYEDEKALTKIVKGIALDYCGIIRVQVCNSDQSINVEENTENKASSVTPILAFMVLAATSSSTQDVGASRAPGGF